MTRLSKIGKKNIVEKELSHRKEKADREWKEIMRKIDNGQIPSRFEITSAMEACNLADGAIIFHKYRN